MQLPRFRPTSDWTAPRLSDLPSWDGARRVGFDLETCDPYLKERGPGVRTGGYITGFSIYLQDGPKFYLPIAHAGGGNLDLDQVQAYVRDNAARFTGDVVGANLQYDLDYSAEQGIFFPQAFMRDVQVAEPLLDELQMQYSLKAIAERRGLSGKDEALLREFARYYGLDPKADMWKLPACAVGPYAEQDGVLPVDLIQIQEKLIDAQGLRRIYDMECRLQPVLVKMKRRGVRIDCDKLDHVEGVALSKELKALKEITRLTGVNLSRDDTNKSAVWIPIMKKLGYPIGRTAPTEANPTGQDSLTKPMLVEIVKNERTSESAPLTVPELIMDAKKWNKVTGTFCASIKRDMVNGRIHCTFNQMIGEDEDESSGGARYGRLSCKQPNLQQQPSRDPEIGPLWRSIYLPDEGLDWYSLDYSTQEPRWATHYAELEQIEGAAEAAQMYRDDPETDFHAHTSGIVGIIRKAAKEIGLGRMYGMGGGKMAQKLFMPTEMKSFEKNGKTIRYLGAGPECQAMIDKFDAGFPWMKKLAKLCELAAKEKGYIITAGGRHVHFPKLWGGKGYDWIFKALNRLVQGSSGDQMKSAMVLLDDEGIPIQLQVHDEVDGSMTSTQAKDGCEIMMDALPCNVPHLVKPEHGPSWGEIS